jgi:hypothetical protein
MAISRNDLLVRFDVRTKKLKLYRVPIGFARVNDLTIQSEVPIKNLQKLGWKKGALMVGENVIFALAGASNAMEKVK